MPDRKTILFALLAALAVCATDVTVAVAQEKADKGKEASARQPARDVAIAPVATKHRLALAAGALDYTAVAETLPVINERGETTAQVAVIAYTAAGSEAAARPVTFVFNGGPGASSAFLQLGALGPKVLVMGPNGAVPRPPARIKDNADSWLAFTDLVFVDPVGAGFSRATKSEGEANKPFWSVSGDTRSLAELIRLWLTRNGRWSSPKFIAGESYGGYRGAKIARALLEDHGTAFNGLILISPALDLSIIRPRRNDVLSWALALPSMVASAQAHDKGDPATSFDEVERFAMTDYLTAIAAIAPAGPGPEPAIISHLAKLLGLREGLVRSRHGRVPATVFAERLLEDSGQALSLYDGTVAGPSAQPGRRGPDPQLDAIQAPLSTAYNAYIRDELKLETDLPFRLLNRDTARNWDWENARRGGDRDGAMDELAEAVALTPGLRVLVVHGRTDLVTPYMTSRWLLDRIELPEVARARIRLEVLPGGHMMYLRDEQRQALTRIAAALYRD